MEFMSFYILVLLAVSGWVAAIAIYRIIFHPLAKIPGPKLAAITQLYQTYFSYIKNESRYYQKVEQLHKKYGPVVRITPDEVSLSDPENYSKIYHMGSKYSKSPNYYRVFGAPAAFFTTIENKLHAARRAELNPFFSRRAVLALEPVVLEKAHTLLARLKDDLDAKGAVELHDLFAALSVDVASDYSFNDSYKLLNIETYGRDFSNMIRGVLKMFWFFMQSSTLHSIALSLPTWVSGMEPRFRRYNTMLESTKNKVRQVKSQLESGQDKPLRRTIFHDILTSEAVQAGATPPSVEDMTDIALTIMVAAAAATGNALSITTFHVLENKYIYSRLYEELLAAYPDEKLPMGWADLEKLPYLTAIIKEGLRLSYGVIGRLPRVVPDGGAEFNGHFLPAGSIVGMSTWMMHRSPSIFPEPDKFDPERWLNPSESARLGRYLVSFGKDSRQCIGMPLAYCEIYIVLAVLFRNLDALEVYQTRPEDLVFDDYFSGYHPDNANPLRVCRSKKTAQKV